MMPGYGECKNPYKSPFLDFEYFGLLNGDECHCGNSAPRFVPTHSSRCNKPCGGDTTQFCGGSKHFNVYKTIPEYPLVHITGSMSTTKVYDEGMVLKSSQSYKNFKIDFETEIQTLLESDPLVVEATVSMTDIKESVTKKRRKRSNDNVVAEFVAVSSIRLATIDNMDEIQSSINSSIQNTDVNLYNLIDEESLASVKLSFEKPKIINIETPSKEEITELIGLN